MTSAGPTRTILVADDDPVARTLVTRTLRNWGYDVALCEDGQAALARLEGPDAPRVAILDWMMPKLEGPDVCRLARLIDQPHGVSTVGGGHHVVTQ